MLGSYLWPLWPPLWVTHRLLRVPTEGSDSKYSTDLPTGPSPPLILESKSCVLSSLYPQHLARCLAHGEKLAHSFILSTDNRCTPAMCSEAEDAVENKTEEVLVSRKFIF